MLQHTRQCDPGSFADLLSGAKVHDLWLNDQDYTAGDEILIQELDGALTGRRLLMQITYVTSDDIPCALSKGALKTGYCIVSLKRKDA